MLRTPDWYFDEAGNWIAFITALILLIIFIKKLSFSRNEIEKSLKCWIYSLYISHLFLTISGCAQVSLLPILQALNTSTDQQDAWKIIMVQIFDQLITVPTEKRQTVHTSFGIFLYHFGKPRMQIFRELLNRIPIQ